MDEPDMFYGRRPHYRLAGVQYAIKQWCDSVGEEQPYQQEDES